MTKLKNRDNSLVKAAQGIAARKKREPQAKRTEQPKERLDGPTDAQLANGDYKRDFVTNSDENTKAMAYTAASDPVEKWRRKGKLTPTEVTTIHRLQEVWQVVYGEIGMTAGYSEATGGRNGSEGSQRSQERILALREALWAIEGEFKGLEAWYRIFERVCRFGEHPLEAAGNRDKALAVVRFVADIIAAKKMI